MKNIFSFLVPVLIVSYTASIVSMQSESCGFFATLQRQRPLNIGDCIIVGGQRYSLIEYKRAAFEHATLRSRNNSFCEELVFCKEGVFLNNFVVSFFSKTTEPDQREEKSVRTYTALTWKSKLLLGAAIGGVFYYYKDALGCKC